MKKFFIVIPVFLLLIFCGCGAEQNTNEKNTASTEIVVNMPTDNTVNGYRLTAQESGVEMPDSIDTDEVTAGAPSHSADTDKGENSNVGKSDAYVINKNSKVFHKPDCSSAKKMKDENKGTATDRDQLIKDGYKPCKRCNP